MDLLLRFLEDIAIGGISGFLSGYIGVRIAIGQLQTWRDIRDGDIKTMGEKIGKLNDDSTIYNQEIGALMHRADLKRIPRQNHR